MGDLAALGWDADLAATFAELAGLGHALAPGRVVLEHNHVYRVMTEAGEFLAQAAGRLKFFAAGREELPAVGDWVGVRLPTKSLPILDSTRPLGPSQVAGEPALVAPAGASPDNLAMIRLILPRRSCFSRRAAGRGTEEQVVAANIDCVFLVSSLDRPPKLRSIERYLVVARQSGARPVLVLNKADLAADLGEALSQVQRTAPDVPVHAVSARDGRGFEWLAPYLAVGRTVALLGPSGAGKSSIVNRLAGRDLLPTIEVREWDARGRHASVHRQLIVLERGGVVIDTPGMRELQPWETDEALEGTFQEIEALAGSCRFRDCRHEREPGCAVKAAVADGRLDSARYDSYVRLAQERDVREQQQAERALLDRKRQGKIGAKAYRTLQRWRGH